jgi:hypothetical protein
LLEKVGAVTLGFRLVVEPAALRLVPAGFWFCGVRWFRALAPRADAVEIGREDGCAVVVRAFAPGLGLLVQYEGLVVPE